MNNNFSKQIALPTFGRSFSEKAAMVNTIQIIAVHTTMCDVEKPGGSSPMISQYFCKGWGVTETGGTVDFSLIIIAFCADTRRHS
jgi:hypothetical protein